MGMAKLRVLCAAVALLCAAPPGQPGAVLPAGEGDAYGVKLCGREFIRAVIFTCGGSRWKRLSLLAVEPAPAAAKDDNYVSLNWNRSRGCHLPTAHITWYQRYFSEDEKQAFHVK
ncbi:hypothetical protein TURU_019330 [Turdus rufiventris]|nr:hypothetical protein TURU_019330 [Turdus rufiventris]